MPSNNTTGYNEIGFGFAIIGPNGQVFQPDLFDWSGQSLPQAWYTLVWHESEPDKLLVLPERKMQS